MSFQSLGKNKRGMGLATNTVMDTSSLIIGVIIALIIVSTLLGANLLTSGSQAADVAGNMSNNFSSGINNISTKIPTIFSVVAIVIILGVLGLLVLVWRKMSGSSQGGGL